MHVAATLRRAIANRHGRPEDGRNAWALAMSSTLPTSIINPAGTEWLDLILAARRRRSFAHLGRDLPHTHHSIHSSLESQRHDIWQ
jgi:hypothetical protein